MTAVEGWVTLPGGHQEFVSVTLVPIDNPGGYLIQTSDGKGYRFVCLRCAAAYSTSHLNMSHLLATGYALPMPATVNPPVCSDIFHREKAGQSPA